MLSGVSYKSIISLVAVYFKVVFSDMILDQQHNDIGFYYNNNTPKMCHLSKQTMVYLKVKEV